MKEIWATELTQLTFSLLTAQKKTEHKIYPYAAEAAELGAMGAETSIPQFLHADEAAKHLCDALHRDRGETSWNSLNCIFFFFF